MRYYEVEAKCGHVGKNKYIKKCFYILTVNGKQAAQIVRNAPRVKHDHKDAIIYVKEINKQEYDLGMENFYNDEYFTIANSSEQKEYSVTHYDELIEEEHCKKFKKNRNIEYKQKKYQLIEAFSKNELIYELV